ncbi:MAG: RNA 3'-terminal phosphate cyclase [Anaerolineae bacterium]|nr:RNA 3'-terminal phosphate cyclase [Anaerolineae bacterium]
MIRVDGSAGEGGGQVLRSALTLSMLTGQATEVYNIRAGRPQPGLRPQHLAAVVAAAAICDAEVQGAELEQQAIRFAPGGPARPGSYTFDVAEIAGQGSAGAIGLLLQTVLLPLALAGAPSQLTLRGGTHVPWAPSVDYIERVFMPAAARMGIRAQIELVKWGFYPAGGGEARVDIQAGTTSLQPLQLAERGPLQRVVVRGVAANLPSHIPQRMVNRARNLLQAQGLPVDLQPLRVRSAGPGATTAVWAEYEQGIAGFSAYGRKGLASEHVAAAACDEFLAHHHSGAPLDPYLADQLVLPLALATGTSHLVTSAISRHLLTNLAVVQAFVPLQARVTGELGQPGTVVITRSTHD